MLTGVPSAEELRGEVADVELRSVPHQQQHAIAGRHAVALQPGGDPRRRRLDIANGAHIPAAIRRHRVEQRQRSIARHQFQESTRQGAAGDGGVDLGDGRTWAHRSIVPSDRVFAFQLARRATGTVTTRRGRSGSCRSGLGSGRVAMQTRSHTRSGLWPELGGSRHGERGNSRGRSDPRRPSRRQLERCSPG